MSDDYNGYANYETWCVCLWTDNEQGSQLAALELARECLREAAAHPNVVGGIWTEDQAARFAFEERFRSLHEDGGPELPASVYSDLLTHALGRVDWTEVARRYVDEAREEAAQAAK